jgi:hypothetical protein
VLRGLFDVRVMTIAHVAALYFDGHHEAAKKRLQRLKSARLLAERPRRPYEPSVLSLAKRGFERLTEEGQLVDSPDLSWQQVRQRCSVSDLTLRHELAVMDVKAAFVPAVRRLPGCEVTEFSTRPVHYQFEACNRDGRSVLVKPDGFIRVRESTTKSAFRERLFFLEVDRSTEAQDVLTERASCYRDYYRSGNFARHLLGEGARGEDAAFRVLFVFKTAGRMINFAERVSRLHPPILRQAWLTTFGECLRDPTGKIWMRPQDYLDVVRGTAFDPLRGCTLHAYRYQAARDHLVQAAVRRLPLIDVVEHVPNAA